MMCKWLAILNIQDNFNHMARKYLFLMLQMTMDIASNRILNTTNFCLDFLGMKYRLSIYQSMLSKDFYILHIL